MSDSDHNPDVPTVSGTPNGTRRPAPASAEPPPEVPGYRITGRLGEGGMGTVWRAEQLGTRRDVALKILVAGTLGATRARRRFEREVELAAGLTHPNIARVYDSGLQRGAYYYAMELVDGVPLDAFVQAHPLNARQILGLMRRVCRGVQHAHQHGVIHRDLKPSNILVGRDAQPRVLDFGLAKLSEAGGLEVTQAGEVAGTPAYMAPEQAAGKTDQISTRTDVYALGVILYRLLTGRPPHDLEGTRYEVFRRIAEEEVVRPREARGSLDADLEALLLKALAKDPEQRYASAGELAADLTHYLSGEPLTARTPTTWYFLGKRARRYRWPLTLAATVLLVVVGTAAYSYVRIGRALMTARAARTRAESALRRADSERARAVEAARRERSAREALADKQAELITARNEADRQAQSERDAREQAQRALALAEQQRRRAEQQAEKARLALEAKERFRSEARREADAARRAKIATSQQELRAAQSKDKADRAVYARRISQALAALKAEDVREARRLLDACAGPHPGWEYRYLHKVALAYRRLTVGGRLHAMALNGDANLLAVAGDGAGGGLTIWDLSHESRLARWQGAYRRVALSDDGRWAAAAGEEGLSVREVQTGKEVFCIDREGGCVRAMAFRPGTATLLTGLAERQEDPHGHTYTYGQWRLSSYGFPGGRVVPINWGNPVRYLSPCGRFAVQGPRPSQRDIRLLDLPRRTSSRVSSLWLPDPRKRSQPVISVSADGEHIAVAVRRQIQLLQRTTAHGSSSWSRPQSLGGLDEITSLQFSPDGSRLASGYTNGAVELWSVARQKPVGTLALHDTAVTDLRFMPDQRGLITCSVDGDVALWRESSLAPHVIRLPKGGRPIGVGDGSYLAVRDGPGLMIVNMVNGDVAWTCQNLASALGMEKLTQAAIRSMAWSPDGTVAAVGAWGDHSGFVRTWSFDRRSSQGSLDLPWSVQAPATLSPDGRYLVAFDRHGRLCVFDLSHRRVTWQVLQSVVRHATDFRRPASDRHGLWGHVAVAFIGDEPKIAVTDGRTALLLTTDNVQPVRAVRVDGGVQAKHVAICRAERTAACIGSDGSLYAFSLTTGDRILHLPPDQARRLVTLSPDGRRLACATQDGIIRLRDATYGYELLTLSDAQGTAEHLAFTPDGNHLVIVCAASSDVAGSRSDAHVVYAYHAPRQSVVGMKPVGDSVRPRPSTAPSTRPQ